MATDAEIAWAAGLFEGEGSWGVYGQTRGTVMATATLGMTDRDVVEKFCRIVGVGAIHVRPHQRGNRKTMYVWTVGKAESVRTIVEMFQPWLGERRRERGTEVLRLIAHIQPHNKDRTHCPQGHPYSGDNLLVTEIHRKRGPGLVRRCRACLRLEGRVRARKRLGITPDRYRLRDEGGREERPPSHHSARG